MHMKPSDPGGPGGAHSSSEDDRESPVIVHLELDTKESISIPPRELESLAERVLSAERFSGSSISVLIEGDDTVRNLNRRYRGLNEPTDVLTFVAADSSCFAAAFEEAGELHHAGDIIISLPAVRRNADTFRIEEEEELRRVLIHGVLHICGWQHETNDADEPMLRRQEELLRSLVPGTAS